MPLKTSLNEGEAMCDFFYYYGYGYFSYLIFMLPALVISLWAQISVKSTFHKYSGLRTGRGLTGAQAAQEVLRFHNVMASAASGWRAS